MKREEGFTLIELLIVIAILGILATVAITSYVGVQLKAMRSEAYSNLESLRLLEEQFFAENADYAPTGGGTISYDATPPVGACVVAGGIEDALPGFRPGGCTCCAAPYGLNFTYAITQNVALTTPVAVPFAAGATVVLDPCFVATATGVAGTRVAGDVFAIDCNNAKNF